MRVNRRHMDANRTSMVHSLFPDIIGGPDEVASKHGIVSGRRVLQELMNFAAAVPPAIILADTGSLKDSSATTKSG